MCLMEVFFFESMLLNMKIFLFCGEVLLNEVVRKLIECFFKVIIMNMYGLIEVIVVVIGIYVIEEVFD